MPTTMQLLDTALRVDPSAAAWCKKLGVSRNTLAVAKVRGRLSPTIAGSIAKELGQDERDWISLAALEAEPPSNMRDTLMKRLSASIRML